LKHDTPIISDETNKSFPEMLVFMGTYLQVYLGVR
jgi:hypothetical protein